MKFFLIITNIQIQIRLRLDMANSSNIYSIKAKIPLTQQKSLTLNKYLFNLPYRI